MKDEKILKSEILSDEELDNVAGGTYIESFNVAGFLYQAGFDDALNDKGVVNFSEMRSALKQIGIEANDHGGVAALGGTSNTYKVIATGETLDQAGMMNFLRNKYPSVRFKEIVEPKDISDVLGMIS